ncbi:hypothetical protein Dsin_028805 [Dipteronia sinensis]|uniref:Uncharacterized protein n=1 Tax=Dipteronia sinensis TaxID=43782 RepID=A0AAD9ZRK9_9ROSI|nr:hypothetical protein Dsin_028805 [Dipteronia sinensis]
MRIDTVKTPMVEIFKEDKLEIPIESVGIFTGDFVSASRETLPVKPAGVTFTGPFVQSYRDGFCCESYWNFIRGTLCPFLPRRLKPRNLLGINSREASSGLHAKFAMKLGFSLKETALFWAFAGHFVQSSRETSRQRTIFRVITVDEGFTCSLLQNISYQFQTPPLVISTQEASTKLIVVVVVIAWCCVWEVDIVPKLC